MKLNFKRIFAILIIINAILAFLFIFKINRSSSYTTISPQEAKEMIDNEDVIILDVRTSLEFNEGHLVNAILLPLDEINTRVNSSLYNKNEKIIVYCRSGNRSSTASDLLVNLGYTNIYNVDGGIINWQYEIVK